MKSLAELCLWIDQYYVWYDVINKENFGWSEFGDK